MNEIIYKRLKALYDQGKATETTLRNAVAKGWITDAQVDEIMGINKEEVADESNSTEENAEETNITPTEE